jgi:hypothetical protein
VAKAKACIYSYWALYRYEKLLTGILYIRKATSHTRCGAVEHATSQRSAADAKTLSTENSLEGGEVSPRHSTIANEPSLIVPKNSQLHRPRMLPIRLEVSAEAFADLVEVS